MNNRKDSKLFQRGNTTSPKRKHDELIVKGGLAITPARALEMAKSGVPISSQNCEGFFPQGDAKPDWSIPMERMRGVDPADLWQESRNIKSKYLNAHRNDVNKYGE